MITPQPKIEFSTDTNSYVKQFNNSGGNSGDTDEQFKNDIDKENCEPGSYRNNSLQQSSSNLSGDTTIGLIYQPY